MKPGIPQTNPVDSRKDVTLFHLANLGVHIGAGAIGILIAIGILFMAKGTLRHRRQGQLFALCVLLVCVTATLGNIFFRFVPVFALLTVLVLYQLLSGWRSVRTKADGPGGIDAVLTASAVAATGLILFRLQQAPAEVGSNAAVVNATLAAIAVMLAYDTVRWVFPRTWFGRLWIYDHIYKLIASFGALLSAFAGNTLRFAQPWSQILPSVIGGLLIIWYFWRQARRDVRPVLLRSPREET
ncbi:MAG: hypothetical protein V4633_00075 [Pseudomonadota bacterium]